MRQANISLETAKQMYKQGGVARQFALDNYSKDELTEPDWPKNWEDLGEIKGWIKSAITHPRKFSCKPSDINADYMFPTTEDIASSLAFKKLRFLADKMNDGWEQEEAGRAYTVVNLENKLNVSHYDFTRPLIAFKTKKMAEFSRKHHRELWEHYRKIK